MVGVGVTAAITSGLRVAEPPLRLPLPTPGRRTDATTVTSNNSTVGDAIASYKQRRMEKDWTEMQNCSTFLSFSMQAGRPASVYSRQNIKNGSGFLTALECNKFVFGRAPAYSAPQTP